MTGDDSLRCIVRVLSAGDIRGSGLPLERLFEATSGPMVEDCSEDQSHRDCAGRPRCPCILNAARNLRGGSEIGRKRGSSAKRTIRSGPDGRITGVARSRAATFAAPAGLTPPGSRRNGGPTDARRLGWRMFVGGWSSSGMPSGPIDRRRHELALADECRGGTDPLKVWCRGQIDSSRSEVSESGAGLRTQRQSSQVAPALRFAESASHCGHAAEDHHYRGRPAANRISSPPCCEARARAGSCQAGARPYLEERHPAQPATMANDGSCRRSQALSRRRSPARRSSAPMAPTGERVRGCRGTVAASGREDAGRK